ncbi:MAG: hypothetical protein Kow0077_23100 [Anaerolineae bacterium]
MSDFVRRLVTHARAYDDDQAIQPRLPARFEDWDAEEAPPDALPQTPATEHAAPPARRATVPAPEAAPPPRAGPPPIPAEAAHPPDRPHAAPETPNARAEPAIPPVPSPAHAVIGQAERRVEVTITRREVIEAPPVDPAVPLPPDPVAPQETPPAPPSAAAPADPIPPAVQPAPLHMADITAQVDTAPTGGHVVKVSIGRIEVHIPRPAPQPAPGAAKAPRKPAFRPAMSLSDYLNRQRK